MEELIIPDPSSSVRRSVARTGKHLDEDTETMRDASPNLRSQWAADITAMRGRKAVASSGV